MLLSRTLRAETRSRGKDDSKRPMQAVDKVRRWEKRWMTINDTTMKIYKWVPIASDNDRKKNRMSTSSTNKENKFCPPTLQMGDDSNTAFSTMSDSQQSQDAVDFSSTRFNMNED